MAAENFLKRLVFCQTIEWCWVTVNLFLNYCYLFNQKRWNLEFVSNFSLFVNYPLKFEIELEIEVSSRIAKVFAKFGFEF